MSISKVAIVTGSARGIGRATALALAADGRAVACAFASDDAGAKETVEMIQGGGGQAAAFATDVSSQEAVRSLFEQVAEWSAPPLILVNNAGANKDGLTVKFPLGEFERIVGVNLTGSFLCARAALPGMMKARWGRIVNVSSAVALRSNAGQAAYAASKTAVLGLTRTLAREYGSRGITANAVCPGFVETAMTTSLSERVREGLREQIPAGRIGEPEEIAAAIRFLASDDASYVNGAVLSIDGGMTA